MVEFSKGSQSTPEGVRVELKLNTHVRTNKKAVLYL